MMSAEQIEALTPTPAVRRVIYGATSIRVEDAVKLCDQAKAALELREELAFWMSFIETEAGDPTLGPAVVKTRAILETHKI